jgi:FSR family fosmidomycin resistance protein-like MFS transporter
MAKSMSAISDSFGQALETRYRVLTAISVSHFLNDMMQSLIVAIYPLLKGDFHLSFTQIGAISLTYQLCASLLQPFIGSYTDKHPQPYSLSAGMGATLAGLIVLAFAPSYAYLLLGAALIGTGSSIFHPESSRIARLASGGRHGLAQSIFQVGGSAGSSMGPLLAAWIIIPWGQKSVACFALAALAAMLILARVGRWYKEQHLTRPAPSARRVRLHELSPARVRFSLSVLVLLLFSKYFYIASITSYLSFYLIEKFHVSVREAQLLLFLFLFASAIGTLFGGPIGDRVGRKIVIWVSILGVAPMTLLLPHVGLGMSAVLVFLTGLVLSSAFSAILVFAQELIPGKVGAISGVFFGFAFGIGGIGAAVLGGLADQRGIQYVFEVCAYLPLLGLATAFLPNLSPGAKVST